MIGSRFRSLLLPAGVIALALGMLCNHAHADTSFTVKRMTRDDVPSGQGQCDLRIRVDNEVNMMLRADRVEIRTVAGRDPRDAGSECNFPLPVGDVNNFRWEKRDGRGRVELMETPDRRNGNRAIFNIRDGDGGEGRYHVRIKWDIEGSSNFGGGRPGRPNRPGGGNNSGWGNDGNSGWGGSGSNSGWGNSNGWGNVTPPSSLGGSGRGTVQWDGRENLTARQATIRVNGNRATIQINTTANRRVEFRGTVRSSSEGLFEVDLNDSSEGRIEGVARVDYRNRDQLERMDIYGNAGSNRFRIDFRR